MNRTNHIVRGHRSTRPLEPAPSVAPYVGWVVAAPSACSSTTSGAFCERSHSTSGGSYPRRARARAPRPEPSANVRVRRREGRTAPSACFDARAGVSYDGRVRRPEGRSAPSVRSSTTSGAISERSHSTSGESYRAERAGFARLGSRLVRTRSKPKSVGAMLGMDRGSSASARRLAASAMLRMMDLQPGVVGRCRGRGRAAPIGCKSLASAVCGYGYVGLRLRWGRQSPRRRR